MAKRKWRALLFRKDRDEYSDSWFSKKNISISLVLLLVIGVGGWLGSYYLTLNERETVSSEVHNEVPAMGAAITYAEGSVSYGDGQYWQEALSGTQPLESQHIRTDASSRSSLTFDDGTIVRLSSETQIEISKLSSDTLSISLIAGEAYVRVAPSSSREFNVAIGQDVFTATGTAFLALNTELVQGIQVFHGSVSTTIVETELREANAFYVKHPEKDKRNKIITFTSKSLLASDFLKWNAEQDKQNPAFSELLGVLDVYDEPIAESANEQEMSTNATVVNSTLDLSAQKLDEGITFSWNLTDVKVDGFKLVKSRTPTPVYGEHDSKFISGDKRTFTWKITDGKQYNFRICVYDSQSGTCSSYSNIVTAVAPFVEPEKVQSGPITAELDANILRWNIEGTAPYGFKVVYNENGDPRYEAAKSFYTDKQEIILSELETGTYYLKICKFTNMTQQEACVDYSDEIIFVVD